MAELEATVDRHPLEERPRRQLMIALSPLRPAGMRTPEPLPAAPTATDLVGRDDAIAGVTRLVERTGFVTLTGPAGSATRGSPSTWARCWACGRTRRPRTPSDPAADRVGATPHDRDVWYAAVTPELYAAWDGLDDRHGVWMDETRPSCTAEDELSLRVACTDRLGRDPVATGDEPVGLSCRVYDTPEGPAGADGQLVMGAPGSADRTGVFADEDDACAWLWP